MTTVDLNSDLGEGFGHWTLGDDDALLTLVTSANVACGFHASDASIMRRVCARAVETGVAIGAHVGYRDLPGFGRRFIDIEPEALTAGRDLPDRRARRLRPDRRLAGAIRQAARRAVQRDRAPRGAGGRRGRGRHRLRPRRCRCWACRGSAWLRLAGEAGLTVVDRGLRRPRLHARGDAGLAPAARFGAARPPTRSPAAAWPWPPAADQGRRGRHLRRCARLDLRARRHPRRRRDRPRRSATR